MSFASQPSATQQPTQTTDLVRGVGLSTTVLVAGVMLTGLVAGAVLSGTASPTAPAAASSEINAVPSAELTAAMVTLNAAVASGLVVEAKSCRTPLAMMTLSKVPGAPDGEIRIRSGSYLSPIFRVIDTPQRIAVPFPSAYALGHGLMKVEGSLGGVQLTLSPVWTATYTSNTGVINLVWRNDKPCAV